MQITPQTLKESEVCSLHFNSDRQSVVYSSQSPFHTDRIKDLAILVVLGICVSKWTHLTLVQLGLQCFWVSRGGLLFFKEIACVCHPFEQPSDLFRKLTSLIDGLGDLTWTNTQSQTTHNIFLSWYIVRRLSRSRPSGLQLLANNYCSCRTKQLLM